MSELDDFGQMLTREVRDRAIRELFDRLTGTSDRTPSDESLRHLASSADAEAIQDVILTVPLRTDLRPETESNVDQPETFMGTNAMNESDLDHKRLKAFIAFYYANYVDLSRVPADLHPSSLLEREEVKAPGEIKAPGETIDGVRTMVNRIIEGSFNWTAYKIAEVEAALTENGIISLSELQKRFSKEYKAIIKRGEISDLTEYYMAKDLVSNTGSVASRREKERLEDMIAVFEQAELDRFKQKQRSV